MPKEIIRIHDRFDYHQPIEIILEVLFSPYASLLIAGFPVWLVQSQIQIIVI